MDVRESLIKICDTDFGYVDEVPAEEFADYLLANDVTLVKHGKWKCRAKHLGECSECAEVVATRYKYCPNCGARMDGDT